MNKQISTSSKVYAESLIQISDNYDEILKNFEDIIDTYNSSDDFKKFVESPVFSNDKKNEIIDDIFKNKITSDMLNFLKILIDKNKFNELEQIYAAYLLRADEFRNIKRVDVVSAIDLSDEWKNKITDKLKTKFNKTIIANWTKDEDIIGGLIIKSDDEVIDSSIRNKLYMISKI